MRRKLLIFVGIASGICWLINTQRLISTLFTEYLYKRDFVQLFLMGHALRAGVNLYAPIPVLAAQFDPNLDKWFQVSAYPPIVAVIGLPLSYLPYLWSLIAWTVFQIGCLALATGLILRYFGGRSASIPVLVTVFTFIGWWPVYVDLYLGQLMLPILLLLTLSWLALKTGKDFAAGVLLGTVIAIKLYGWPIALFLFIMGHRRASITAFIVFIAANILMVAWTGSGTVVDYYSRVGPTVLAQYQFDPFNFSAWSNGFRSFGAWGARTMSLTVLLGSLFLAIRSRDFDSGFMIMLAASTILQPVSWIHYLVTLLPAFAFVANRREFRMADLVLALFLIILILPGFHPMANTYPAIASWPPVIFIIGLMWLIVPKAVKERTAMTNVAPEAT